MGDQPTQRRLAAILAADVAGYTRLMELDTDGTVAAWQAARQEVIKPTVDNHSGKIVKLTGDGFLVEFSTVQDAVNCAIAMQRGLASSSLDFRMGVNLGDIVDDGEDIHGEGVNVAARLEGLADPGGICISGDVYNQIRNRVDAIFEDMGQQEVKNVSAPVQAYAVRLDGSAAPSPSASPAISDKPSIAVLPFDNMSGDTNQEYFVDGITEDIITALSKNHWLSVIARNSTFAYKGKSPDVRTVADELGAEYVIEGSVRKSGNRIRITAQLIDATSSKHIWAERYDRDLEDIFAVQDEITETITATIEPELGAFESKRAKNKPTENLGAWDCYHLGLSHLYKFSKDSNREAQRLFRRAIELDANFSAAHARLAYAVIISAVYFDTEPTPELLDDALHAAQRAAKLDDQDALAYFALGRAHLARSEYDLALAAMETSIELNPSLAQAHCGLGDALAYAGRLEESLSRFEEAIRLSPHDPYRWGFLMYGSLAQLFLKRHEAAADWARKAVSVPNSHYWANAALVAALGHLDRPDETRSAVEELLQRIPEFTCSFAKDHLFYIKSSAQVDHYVEGLRKAGLPESAVGKPDPTAAAPAIADKPSIAVLPFNNLSGDPEQEYFADGMTEDIITGLSHFRSLFVIARNSTFAYKGKSPDVRQVARDLGVRYVLEGSVRRSGERIRITGQLIDARTGNHLWAEHYDRELEDIFAVQDEITEAIIAAIAPEIDEMERSLAQQKPPGSLDAWGLYQRGLTAYYATTKETLESAIEQFDNVNELDPAFAPAFAMAADARVRLVMHFLSGDDELLGQAREKARLGITLDSRDPICLWVDGRLHSMLGQHEIAISKVKESIALNPNSAMAHYVLGFVLGKAGHPEDAISHIEHAMRLSPRDVFTTGFLTYGSVMWFFAERYNEAFEWAQRASRSPNPRYQSFCIAAASLIKLGRREEATVVIADFMVHGPKSSLSEVRNRLLWNWPGNTEAIEQMVDALREAGLPE